MKTILKTTKSPKLKNEFYFTLYLTEDEHCFVQESIREFGKNNGFEVVYYRKLKSGHQPMRRECKIRGDVNQFIKFAHDEKLVLRNYPRTLKEQTKAYKAGQIDYFEFEKSLRRA